MYISEMFTRNKGSTVRRGPKPSAGAWKADPEKKDREISFRNFSTKEILSKFEYYIRAALGWIQTLFLWILKSLNFGISTIPSDSQYIM